MDIGGCDVGQAGRQCSGLDDKVVRMVYPHAEPVARQNVAHPLDEASVRGRRGGDFEGDKANRYAGRSTLPVVLYR